MKSSKVILALLAAAVMMTSLSVANADNKTGVNDDERKRKGYTVGDMPPKEKERYDAYVSKVRSGIRNKLNRFKISGQQGAGQDTDVFVVAELSGSRKAKNVHARFTTVSGVDSGAESILTYLKETPNNEIRDYMILSRHASSSEATTALEQLQGREAELANNVQQQIARREAIRAQKMAQAQAQAAARAAYLSRMRSRTRTVSRRGGSGNC